jgi:hypothetical protein
MSGTWWAVYGNKKKIKKAARTGAASQKMKNRQL